MRRENDITKGHTHTLSLVVNLREDDNNPKKLLDQAGGIESINKSDSYQLSPVSGR
jgi:hypothetical protein